MEAILSFYYINVYVNLLNFLLNYDAVYYTVGGETYERSFKVQKNGGMMVSMLEQPDINDR